MTYLGVNASLAQCLKCESEIVVVVVKSSHNLRELLFEANSYPLRFQLYYLSAETIHIFIYLKLSTHPRRAVATHRTVLKLLMIQTLIFCKLPSRSPARRWRRVLLETPCFCVQLCFRVSLQVKFSIFERINPCSGTIKSNVKLE